MVRCGNPLRRRVVAAEWRFRQTAQPSISESTLVDAANQVAATAGAPSWLRVSVEEVHVIRTALRPFLPRFVGTVKSELQLSDQMSPAEAVFIAMTLGNGMMQDPDDFRGGPDAHLERIRQRQQNPLPASRVVVRVASIDISGDLNAEETVLARSAHRFLDRLGFPP
jgi:hypothetical protein